MMYVTQRKLTIMCAVTGAMTLFGTLMTAWVIDAVQDENDKPKYENSFLGRDVEGIRRCMPNHILMNVGAGILACIPFEKPQPTGQ